MERIVIPGKATYAPLPLLDVAAGAPLASRLLLGASLPGQFLAAASTGYYIGSAAKDWYYRLGVRPIDFQEAFGTDIKTLEPQPEESRRWEVQLLGRALNEGFVEDEVDRAALAERINACLTDYIARITAQEVITSSEIRSVTLAGLLMPGALGSCDPISGDIAIFRDAGPLLPHVIAHEFCHRKGYLKELHAQALAYLALRNSGDPVLVQAARFERLHRQLRVMQRHSERPLPAAELLALAQLRKELAPALATLIPDPEDATRRGIMAALYDQRMRLTGQNGIADYDQGFLDFLWTFGRSASARVDTAHAGL